MVLFPCFRSRSKIEDFTTTLSIPVTDLVECAAGLRPGGGQVIQPAFGQAARPQGESCRKPQGSAVWPSEGLNDRVLVISPQSTLKRLHKAISKKSRGFFSDVVFFCGGVEGAQPPASTTQCRVCGADVDACHSNPSAAVVDHVRQDITHYALSGFVSACGGAAASRATPGGPATLKR